MLRAESFCPASEFIGIYSKNTIGESIWRQGSKRFPYLNWNVVDSQEMQWICNSFMARWL